MRVQFARVFEYKRAGQSVSWAKKIGQRNNSTGRYDVFGPWRMFMWWMHLQSSFQRKILRIWSMSSVSCERERRNITFNYPPSSSTTKENKFSLFFHFCFYVVRLVTRKTIWNAVDVEYVMLVNASAILIGLENFANVQPCRAIV